MQNTCCNLKSNHAIVITSKATRNKSQAT